MRILLTTVVLAGVYALTLASADPWDLGLGAALGLGVTLLFRDFLFTEPAAAPARMLRRIAYLPNLVVGTVIDITRGTIEVARVVLSPKIPRNEGFVEIPNHGRTPSGVVVSGLLNTISPGSVLIDIDPVAETWTIHAIDVSDEEAVIDSAQRFYERYQRPVWP